MTQANGQIITQGERILVLLPFIRGSLTASLPVVPHFGDSTSQHEYHMSDPDTRRPRRFPIWKAEADFSIKFSYSDAIRAYPQGTLVLHIKRRG